MRSIAVKASQFVALIAAMYIVYNMYIFFEIATGKKVAYIPWLHFPIKLFVAIMS